MSSDVSSEFIRRCGTCGAEHAPDIMRCTCGALLFGADLVRKSAPAEAPPQAGPNANTDTAPASASQPLLCPYDDCGQANPAGSETCVYCNRPLASGPSLTSPAQSLVQLPSALASRYRITRPLPATGAEADILLVEPVAGGPACIAKLYRQGILPKSEVQERIKRINPDYRVEAFEYGISDQRAYEVMEYCRHGSLRDWLNGSPLAATAIPEILREIAQALDGVHQAGLVHRDLKPDNILVRTTTPLDLVLTDFGIASVLEATQRFTGVARSLPYAAPESLSGVIDGKADYWALGMILLEGLLGRHPFADLSEPVILHHLTTRSISLDGIADANLRKLLRGLLLRDPKQRWAMAEIRRWLENDWTLVEPVEASQEGHGQAYTVGQEYCNSAEQVAIAYSRNWAAGIADLQSGQLRTWLQDVRRDHNAIRLLLELQYERQLPLDLQLLHFILHFAPGIPPVWRGDSIELPAILSRANQALKGNAEAARWLDSLYRNRVLEIYAEAGNAEAEELVRRWTTAASQFDQAWSEQMAKLKAQASRRDPNEVVLFDDVVFGHQGDQGQGQAPSLLSLHPRLLAIAFDRQWREKLRQYLLAETLKLARHCPWLAGIGQLQTLEAPALLAYEALLPEARKAAARQEKAESRRQQEEKDALAALQVELPSLVAQIKRRATTLPLLSDASEPLRQDLEAFFSLLARLRGQGLIDGDGGKLRQTAMRAEPGALRMQTVLDRLDERRTENRGWYTQENWIIQGLALLLIPRFFGSHGFLLVCLGLVGLHGWRLLPTTSLVQQIRRLGKSL